MNKDPQDFSGHVVLVPESLARVAIRTVTQLRTLQVIEVGATPRLRASCQQKILALCGFLSALHGRN